MIGKLERLQTLAQHTVGMAVAAIRQITREYAKAHVVTVQIDIRDTGHEPLGRIQFQQLSTTRHYVKIRDLHKFHDSPRYSEQQTLRQKTAAMADRDQAAANCCSRYRDCIRALLITCTHRP